MPTPPDPSQLDARRRAQDAREAADREAECRRHEQEAQANAVHAAVVEHLKRTGAEFTAAELAAELCSDPDAVLKALERGVKEGTVMESRGRYRASQHG